MTTRHVLTLAMATVLTACAVPNRAPVNGFLFTHVKTGDNVTENTLEERSVKGCASSFLGVVAWGNASVAGVAGSAGQVSVVDSDELGVLGVYARHCTVVHAGTSEIALTDEPEDPAPPPSGPPKVKYYTEGATPGDAQTGAEPPSDAPPGTVQPGSTAPKTGWGKTPAPDAPTVAPPPGWPQGVAIADRTACSLVCMENGAAADGGQVEVVIGKQLGALRACALHSMEYHAISSSITFGQDGRMTMTVNTSALKPQMRECASHIPAPGYFHGPPNTRWKCTDYCR